MFMNDVKKREEIRTIAIGDLKNLGVKFRQKKCRQVQVVKNNRIFKKPLECLPMETVTLCSGRQLIVPKIVHELCSFILNRVHAEGLFRKGGSKSRQTEIKLLLDAGSYLSSEHHEIDVANILKTFFRELPEPLIPFAFHEVFMRCVLALQGKKQETGVLLSCLLLPTVHLNTLSYFMQFLQKVAEFAHHNKMDSYNLSVVFGPTLMPAEEKLSTDATFRMTKTCELFKLLIENATNIGLIDTNIIDRIAQVSDSSSNSTESCKIKKKKRRSGSLTRMLSGLKKIVTHKTEESVQMVPDLITTPNIINSVKRRKVDHGISIKKRQEIIQKLPQGTLLSVPYTPKTTAKIRKLNSDAANCDRHESQTVHKKRLLWSSKSKSKKPKDTASSTSSIQRRWSAVSSVAGLKKKSRRNSCTDLNPNYSNNLQVEDKLEETKVTPEKFQSVVEEPNYVRISKTEYEEIKKRMTAIERRLSHEITAAESNNVIDDVEKKYEETLERNEQLNSSPTTDQLVKRFSRELKIRQSAEQKIFRSPSARKIGSLRRKETGQKVPLSRTQTWCVTSTAKSVVPTRNSKEAPDTEGANAASVASGNWKSASGYFNTPENDAHLLAMQTDNCRASIARIRHQNAGMVMEKAKLFDNLVEGDADAVVNEETAKAKPKMGASRSAAQLNRIKTLRLDDKRKKMMSPRKRPCRSPGIHRLNKLNNVKVNGGNCEESGNKSTPKMKPSLSAKSPRRIYIRSNLNSLDCNNKGTPLKATSVNCI